MKKIIFPLASLNCFIALGQIEALSYEDVNNIEFFRSIKNNTRTLSYEFENSNVIKVGDTIRFGEPST